MSEHNIWVLEEQRKGTDGWIATELTDTVRSTVRDFKKVLVSMEGENSDFRITKYTATNVRG